METAGGSEILEQPSFPFPPSLPNGVTPLPSLVFLCDALIQQCPQDIDGSIRIKDVIDLIKNDPSHSVASALGLEDNQGIDLLFPSVTIKSVITRDGLVAVFQQSHSVTSSTLLSNATSTILGENSLTAIQKASSSSQDNPIKSDTIINDTNKKNDNNDDDDIITPTTTTTTTSTPIIINQRRADVRGVPFPKPPPNNMTLPPKAPKHPPIRSPKRRRHSISREGGNIRADARGRYMEVLREDPNNTDALEHIGFFYVDANQPEKALESLNRARTLGCDNLRLWRSTGKAHYLKWRQTWKNVESELGSPHIPMHQIIKKMPDDEHLQAAHLAYERCTKFHLFVPDSTFWHELGTIYFHFRAYEGAFNVFKHITRDDPKYLQLNEVVLMCGIMYFRLQKYEESITCFTKLLHSPPHDIKERNVLFILGRLHQLNNNKEQSQASFEEVYDFVRKRNLQVSDEQRSRVESTRDYIQDPDTWYNECKLYVRNGLYELAEDAFNQGLKYSKDEDAKLGTPLYSREHLKNIWVGLSRTYAFRKMYDKSLECMVEAQACRPYDYYVRESLVAMDPNPEKWNDVFLMESKHALSLSRYVRGHLERQRIRRERKIMGAAATKMARIFRGVRWRVRLKSLYLTLVDRRKNVRTRRTRALIRMQSIARMLKVRNEFFRTKMAALKISSGIRGLLGRTKALRRRNEVMEMIRRRNNRAATIVQCCARGFALRTQLNRNWAAIDIQALARGYIQRRRVYFTVKEPQLVETSRSGYPRGTPGHRRHWQRRLEQCEFLYSDRMELRREIGILTLRHPCITPHEAFLALAETTGDVDYASKLLIRDSTFSEELYEMAQSIDVDQYIALRPAPIVGAVAAARRKRTLSRRWMTALSDPIDTRSTSVRVEEMARIEDPGHIDFLERRIQYTTLNGASLPWHSETVSPSINTMLQKPIKIGIGSTRERRGILHSIQKSLTPERTRTFSTSDHSNTQSLQHHQQRQQPISGDRLFAPVSLTQNIFHNVLIDHNKSGLPMTEDVSNIKKRLKDLGVTNLNKSLSTFTGTAKYVDATVSLHDQANSRRSILRKQIKKGRPGKLTTMKHLKKETRQRRRSSSGMNMMGGSV